jgi:hypothetical protein
LLASADVNSFLKASLEHFCSAPPATLAGATPPLLFLHVLHDPLRFGWPVCFGVPAVVVSSQWMLCHCHSSHVGLPLRQVLLSVSSPILGSPLRQALLSARRALGLGSPSGTCCRVRVEPPVRLWRMLAAVSWAPPLAGVAECASSPPTWAPPQAGDAEAVLSLDLGSPLGRCC